MYKGKTKLEDIAALLLQFRTYEIAITADIEKAYHTIQLIEKDRDYCRFIWLKDYNKPPDKDNIEIQRFCRIAFGLILSQFMLNAIRKHHIACHPSPFTEELQNDFYVDNLLSGTSNVHTAKIFYDTAVQIFVQCSMNLRCWATNSPIPRQHFDPEKQDTATVVGTLVLKWDTERDQLYLPHNRIDPNITPSLRAIFKQPAYTIR